MNSVTQEIRKHIALAFQMNAEADYREEIFSAGYSLEELEIDDSKWDDEIDPSCYKAADSTIAKIEQIHDNKPIHRIYKEAIEISERNIGKIFGPSHALNEENFGHYAGMQALGHGVGLYDALGKEGKEYVTKGKSIYVCHGYYDMNQALFPDIPEEDIDIF